MICFITVFALRFQNQRELPDPHGTPFPETVPDGLDERLSD